VGGLMLSFALLAVGLLFYTLVSMSVAWGIRIGMRIVRGVFA